MHKWIAALIALVAGMAGLLWKLSAKSETPTVAVPTFDAAPEVVAAKPTPIPRRRSKPIDAGVVAPTSEQLDPQSEEFSHRLDVGIPDKFRASLARCDRSNFDPDAKISLSYTLHIEGGRVSASNVQVEKSDLGDSALESCMVQAVENATWDAPDLPNTREEQDLFIRIRSLDKYLSAEEQAENKEAARASE